jgi:hypothetical protein
MQYRNLINGIKFCSISSTLCLFARFLLCCSFGSLAALLSICENLLERQDSLPIQKKVGLQWLFAVVTVMLKCVAWHQSEKAAALW